MIGRLVREPLLQFLALGAILFGLYSLMGERSAGEPEKIVVSATRVANLADGFARTWQRGPSQEELQGLIDDYIRDEIFYREGRAAGLDRDDVVIRRRVRQKMEFLAEEVSAPEPSEEQLAAFLASHPVRFRTEDRATFFHVFLNATNRAGTIDEDVKRLEAALVNAGPDAGIDTAELGDPFLLGEEFRTLSRSDTARTFGEDFARQIFALEPGKWQGPIASTFGVHFVFVKERIEGGVQTLDAVKPQVAREWAEARRIEAEQKLYRSLRDRYQITVEAPAPRTASATARP